MIIRDYCDFIPQPDMDAILGGNIAALFGMRLG